MRQSWPHRAPGGESSGPQAPEGGKLGLVEGQWLRCSWTGGQARGALGHDGRALRVSSQGAGKHGRALGGW